MTFHKYFHIGPLRIYLTTYRMKRVMKGSERDRHLRKTLLKIKSQRYRRIGGICEHCGRPLSEFALQIHHVIPVSEAPHLMTAPSNIQLLCPSCHTRIHQAPQAPRPHPVATPTPSAGTAERPATS